MNEAMGFGVLTLIVGALGTLIWYADKSGRSSAQAKAGKNETSLTHHAAQRAKAMDQAKVNKPTSKDAVIARLEKGDA